MFLSTILKETHTISSLTYFQVQHFPVPYAIVAGSCRRLHCRNAQWNREIDYGNWWIILASLILWRSMKSLKGFPTWTVSQSYEIYKKFNCKNQRNFKLVEDSEFVNCPKYVLNFISFLTVRNMIRFGSVTSFIFIFYIANSCKFVLWKSNRALEWYRIIRNTNFNIHIKHSNNNHQLNGQIYRNNTFKGILNPSWNVCKCQWYRLCWFYE